MFFLTMVPFLITYGLLMQFCYIFTGVAELVAASMTRAYHQLVPVPTPTVLDISSSEPHLSTGGGVGEMQQFHNSPPSFDPLSENVVDAPESLDPATHMGDSFPQAVTCGLRLKGLISPTSL
jgi:hypothetical protein